MPLVCLFWTNIQSRITHYIYLSCLLSLLQSGQFLTVCLFFFLPCTLDPLQLKHRVNHWTTREVPILIFLKILASYCANLPFILDLSDASSWVIQLMHFFQVYYGTDFVSSLNHIERYLGRRSLVGSSPWGRLESDTTERLHFHFSLSCIGRRKCIGEGCPLQCSCLENPRDRGA